MNKNLLLTLLCACVAVCAIAGARPIDRVDLKRTTLSRSQVKNSSVTSAKEGKLSLQDYMRDRHITPSDNRLATQSPRQLSLLDMQGSYISSMLSWGILDDYSLDPNPCYVGWEVSLTPCSDEPDEDGWIWCVLENAYLDYYVPVDVMSDLSMARMYFGLIDDYHHADTVGSIIYDTVKTVYVLPALNFLNDDEEWEMSINGTIYDDGSMVFEGDFLFYTEVKTQKIRRPYQTVIKDSTFMVSPVFSDLFLLKPNGEHSFTKVSYGGVQPGANSSNLNKLIATMQFYTIGTGGGTAGTCGVGGIIGTPIDPRPIKPGVVTGRDPANGNGGLSAPKPVVVQVGSDTQYEEQTVPVYMYQYDDSTVFVLNLFGNGVAENYMMLQEDGTMIFPGQQISWDYNKNKAVYNCSLDAEADTLMLGNVGAVIPEYITWGLTKPYTEDGMLSYEYDDNVLYFTDGSQFVIPVPLVLGDVNNDKEVTILDIVVMIDHLLVGDLEWTDKFNIVAADMNEDGVFSVLDVSLLIDRLLSKN